MAWFKRKDKGIQTPTEAKRDTPKGLWYKSPTGKIIETDELERNFYVSPEDGYHVRIGSNEYFEMLFDENKFTELDSNITSKDPLNFTDQKTSVSLPYSSELIKLANLPKKIPIGADKATKSRKLNLFIVFALSLLYLSCFFFISIKTRVNYSQGFLSLLLFYSLPLTLRDYSLSVKELRKVGGISTE